MLSKTNFKFSVIFILSSANASNLDMQSTNLLGSRHFKFEYLHPTLTDAPGGSVVSVLDSMTWWLRVQDPAEAKFLPRVLLPLTSAEACEKWSQRKEICVSTGMSKPGNTCASPTAMI